MPHRLAILVLDAVVPLDLGIAAQLTSYPEAPYAVTFCGARRGRVPTTTGFSVAVEAGPAALRRAETIVVPGFSPPEWPLDATVRAALRRAYREGCRMVSICTGAFALAGAGVLDGRRVTTHWRHAARLASSFPQVKVDPAVLYTDDGQVLTSAGVAAGIDLCLHLISSDHGAAAAGAVARQIVAAPQRPGGQAQFIERPYVDEAGSSLAATRAWALARLPEPLTVGDLARHASVSERTFARRFVAETGTTPLRWLTVRRLEAARELLERGCLGIDEIADRCGLGGGDNLRLHFRREMRTTPSDYRRAFGQTGAAQPSGSARADTQAVE